MKPALTIAAHHVRTLFKDRTALIMMLLLPFILSWVTGLAFGGAGTQAPAYKVPIAFVDNDGTPVAQSIIDAMSLPPYSPQLVSETEARQLVNDRQVSAAIIIPADLQQKLQNNEPVIINVLRANYQESPRMVEQHLNGLLLRIRAAVAAANLAEARGYDWGEVYTATEGLWTPAPPVIVKSHLISRQPDSDIPDGYNQASPGYVVMFGMMTVITAGAVTLLSERDSGNLRRLLAAPITKGQLLAGKTLGIMAAGVLQMSILIALGQIVFNVNWGASLIALAMLVVTLSLAATGIGMFLAALCRTTAQANATGILIVLIMSMLGGSWWPMEVMPRHMQVIAKTVPSGWAMEGFTNIIMRGAGPGEVLIPALVMAAFGLSFLTLGTQLFRFE